MAGGGIKISNIKVTGGANGITPVFKIESGVLYNSYNNGKTWYELGQVKGTDGKDGVKGETGAKIVSQILEGQDVNGGNIYKQTFDDGTIQYFVAPRGPQGPAGSSSDVTIDTELSTESENPVQNKVIAQKTLQIDESVTTLNHKINAVDEYFEEKVGEVEENLDNKVDKITTSGNERLYAIDSNGNPTVKTIGYNPIQSYIPAYGVGGKLKAGTYADDNASAEDTDLINRRHLNEKLEDKVDKPDRTDTEKEQVLVYKANETEPTLVEVVASTTTGSAMNCIAKYGPEGRLVTATPSADRHAANKKYVDDKLNVKLDVDETKQQTGSFKAPLVYTNDTTKHYLGSAAQTYKTYNIPMIFGDAGGKDTEPAGYLITHTPKNEYHCTTKKYVDEKIAEVSIKPTQLTSFKWLDNPRNGRTVLAVEIPTTIDMNTLSGKLLGGSLFAANVGLGIYTGVCFTGLPSGEEEFSIVTTNGVLNGWFYDFSSEEAMGWHILFTDIVLPEEERENAENLIEYISTASKLFIL